MSSRKPRRVRIPPPLTSSSSSSSTDAPGPLVWTDMEPLLNDLRARYADSSTRLDYLRERLERFSVEIEPLYSRWIHTEFGARLTAMRELDARIEELEYLVFEVENEAQLTGRPPGEVYRMRQKIREAPPWTDPEFYDPRHYADEPAIRGYESLSETNQRLVDAEARRIFEEMMMSHHEDLDYYAEWRRYRQMLIPDIVRRLKEEEAELARERHRAGRAQKRAERAKAKARDARAGSSAAGAAAVDPTDAKADLDQARRKQLYREIARRLHPDLNGTMSAREREIWYSAQAAYEAADLERLETLAAQIGPENGPENRSDADDNGTGGGGAFGWVRSPSRLIAMIAEAAQKIRAAERSLRAQRKTPAYEFYRLQSQPHRLIALYAQFDDELAESETQLRHQLAMYERRVESWKQGRDRLRKPKAENRR